jgi:hypothetical protein
MRLPEPVRRWAFRATSAVAAAQVLLAYYYANVRFLPIAAGFGILAGLCAAGRRAGRAGAEPAANLRHPGARPRALSGPVLRPSGSHGTP